jgi:hypothetical protein
VSYASSRVGLRGVKIDIGDDDDRLRSGLAILLCVCMALLPLLIGLSDVPTTLLVSAIGGLVILPGWRHAGQPFTTPAALITFLSLVVGMVVIGSLFDRAAILTFIGGWGATLAAMRFMTDWRDAG